MFFNLLSAQTIRLAITIAVAGLLAFGYYLQYAKGLEPCPLCITQRFFLLLSGVLGLIAFLHKPALRGAIIYGVSGSVLAIIGGGFSSRQLYLQSLPSDQVPACGPSLGFILETFPLSEALSILIRGDGNCAEVTWTFLGLSIPGWTLVVFTCFVIGWVLQVRASRSAAQ